MRLRSNYFLYMGCLIKSYAFVNQFFLVVKFATEIPLQLQFCPILSNPQKGHTGLTGVSLFYLVRYRLGGLGTVPTKAGDSISKSTTICTN